MPPWQTPFEEVVVEGLCCCVEAERSFDGNGLRSRFREGMEHVEDGTRRGSCSVMMSHELVVNLARLPSGAVRNWWKSWRDLADSLRC